ncbi:MAG: dihydroxy-acid dehydratase [Desulfobacterales bacterium]|nr:dihydroxy-acid dehydratase [Desulfobacterales bacterium]
MPPSDKASGIDRNLASYGDKAFSRYLRRAFLASAGYDRNDLERPIIGIADTSSDYNTCHRQMPEMVTAIKRGVLEAGGLPLAFPTISLNEILTSPTTMLFRNLAAMETEEMIRAQPMDAVVLVGGCDKTVPAQAMAAISADIPAIHVVAGPMLAGNWRGQRLGACTDCRRLWTEYRAGKISEEEIREIEASLCATGGTCMVMGTASTMACLIETLGLMLPGGAAPPHATGDRLKQCTASGRCAVELAQANRYPSNILSQGSFHNALTVLLALSGSTNAVVHLLAMARRAGISLTYDDLNRLSKKVPVLVDCKPAGVGYMEDFYHAGGVPVLLKELSPFLDLETMTVTGKTLGETLDGIGMPGDWQSTIRTVDNPLVASGAIVAVSGTLAPNGAVIKAAAASPALMRHQGPAVVFNSPEDAVDRIDDPALGITPDHVLVLRNAGPIGAGMPEAGSLPIPRHLARQGVRDMVRVSDARMSGTAYGTVVLHCAPEAAAGGPLALVKNGDLIKLDVAAGRIDLLVEEEELSRRRKDLVLSPIPKRGWAKLYAEHVLQADEGADLDFL